MSICTSNMKTWHFIIIFIHFIIRNDILQDFQQNVCVCARSWYSLCGDQSILILWGHCFSSHEETSLQIIQNDLSVMGSFRGSVSVKG